MNEDANITLGPEVDPCFRVSDFGECNRIVGNIQDSLILVFIIGISFLLVPLVKAQISSGNISQNSFLRFWVVAYISLVLTFFSNRLIPEFGRHYKMEHHSNGAVIMRFKERADMVSVYRTPFFINYICFYIYDYLYLFIINAVIDIFYFSEQKTASFFHFLLKIYYVLYGLISAGTVVFSLNCMADLYGTQWLNFCYRINFFIHPSILAFFYITCSMTFVFFKDKQWLYPVSFKIIMRLMLFFIMVLTFFQSVFAFYRFNNSPNYFSVWAAFDYPNRRFTYINGLLFYDFIVFIFPLMCLVGMMFIMTRIKEDENTSESVETTSTLKAAFIA